MAVVNNRIKEVRQNAKQTQEDFASKVGISRSNLALIETNKATPTYQTIKKISSAYQVNPAFFFDENEALLSDYLMSDNIVNEPNIDADNIFLSKALPSMVEFKKRIADNPLHQRVTLLKDNKRHLDVRLKRDLAKNVPELLTIKDKLEEFVGTINMVSDVVNNYIDCAPDPSELDYYATETSDGYTYNFPDEVDFKDYKRQTIHYYEKMQPYMQSIQTLKSCAEAFLKEMSPLDVYEIIS